MVGFDGLEISEYLVPSLTTVYQPSFDIGYYAAKFLVEAIADPTGKFQIKFLMRRLLLEKHKTDLKQLRNRMFVLFAFSQEKIIVNWFTKWFKAERFCCIIHYREIGGNEFMRMVDIIEKKRDGHQLTSEEIQFIINGYTDGSIPDYQVSAF